jgi:16S rRNA (adenine1518-N6/adenine1519-N6)-dimethyltransferase
MHPKKSLGQNFLTSIPARLKMVEAGRVTTADTVLEIGPGKGFLTKALLETGAKVIALEKDADLLPLLSESFSSEITTGALTLIEGDALEYTPAFAHSPLSTLHPPLSTYKLIANIPYYITGAILSHFLTLPHQPSCIVVLIQKEVAERACAKDCKESLLSLSIKAYGDPKLVYRVSRGSFNPIPKVDSAILQIENISRKNFKHDYHEAMFFKVIHAAFAHKRKFALSNIQSVFKNVDIKTLFKEANLSEKVRAEDVTLQAWIQISSRLSSNGATRS